MKINLLNSGYVMVSRALLMEVYGKQGAALTDEEAFLRVLVHVNHKSEKTCCGKDEVICQRGESLISCKGWADILGWSRGRTRRFFERILAEGLIEQVPGNLPTHIRILAYDAWTGWRAGKKEPGTAPAKKLKDAFTESLQDFIAHYSEVTQLPAENSGRMAGLWKKLSTGERKQAYDKVDPYYFSLNNTNFCYQAAKYLEYKIFENEFVN